MPNRYFIFHRIFLFFFGFNIVFYIVNDAFLKKIPLEIVGYSFFLSLGLYVGFHVCLGEVKRRAKK